MEGGLCHTERLFHAGGRFHDAGGRFHAGGVALFRRYYIPRWKKLVIIHHTIICIVFVFLHCSLCSTFLVKETEGNIIYCPKFLIGLKNL